MPWFGTDIEGATIHGVTPESELGLLTRSGGIRRFVHMNSAFSFVRNHATRIEADTATMNVPSSSTTRSRVRKFVERVLRDAGYQTTTAGDGAEATRGPTIREVKA
jgi:hypothetical protein